MTRDPSLLDSHQPSSIAPASPAIVHVQLRDLLICPREKGVVNYVSNRAIVEQDMHAPSAPIRMLSKLDFTPNSLCYLPVGQNDTLIAAGGQDAEMHLSYHTASGSSSSRRTRLAWEHSTRLPGSINNSVLLTSMSLTRSNESSSEPRVGVSNNDCSIRFYDIPLHVTSPRRSLQEVGQVRLDIPINHSSISPDGRTLLSVGDANKIFFHGISGGARLSFTPITTLRIPPPDPSGSSYLSASLTAAFSTAFSGDGSKFAVASQEGVIAVWDVRSTKPLKVFQTDKTRIASGRTGNGGASSWLSDDPWEWTRGTKAPGWCARSVKFNGGEGARLGKEVMAFTEHTSLIHIVDARTFETHDILRVPTMERPALSSNARTASSSASTSNWYRPVSSIRSTNNSSSRSGPGMESPDIPFSRIRRSAARRGIPVSNARRTAGLSLPTASQRSSPNPSNSNSNPVIAALSRLEGHTSASPVVETADQSILTATTPSPPALPASSSADVLLRPGAPGRASSLDSAALAIMSSSPSTSTSDHSPVPTPASIAAGLAPRAARRLAMAASIGRVNGLGGRRTASTSNAYPETTPLTLGPSASASTSPTPAADTSSSSPTSSPPSSTHRQATPAIVQALGDAFRIPMPPSSYSPPASIGDSTWRTLAGRGAGFQRGASSASDASADTSSAGAADGSGSASTREARREAFVEDGPEGIVVVPDLGDREMENDMHALFAAHGLPNPFDSRRQRSLGLSDADAEGDVDLDALIAADALDALLGADGDAEAEDVDEMLAQATENWGGNPYLDSNEALARAAENFGVGVLRHVDFNDAPSDEDDYRMDVDDLREEEEEDGDDDVDTEIDEDLEYECASVGNSRSGSPSIRGPTSPTARSSMSRRYGTHSQTHPSPSVPGETGSATTVPSGWQPRHILPMPARALARTSSPSGDASPLQSTLPTRRAAAASRQRKYGYFDDLDLAGLCFDPWGERMYVAGIGVAPGTGVGARPSAGSPYSSHSHGYGGIGLGEGEVGAVGVGAVVEWSVRGAEKRWFVDDGWN